MWLLSFDSFAAVARATLHVFTVGFFVQFFFHFLANALPPLASLWLAVALLFIATHCHCRLHARSFAHVLIYVR